MYSILEASRLTGISRDMIRHYEKLDMIHPERKANGYREYSDRDLFQLVLIRLYSNLGIALKEIKALEGARDVAGMTEALRKEILHTEFQQKLLASRAAAGRHTLHCLEQYLGERAHSIRTIHRRYLCSRNSFSSYAYAELCAQLTERECFFQYYYLQRYVRDGSRFREVSGEPGIVLYDPLPFDIPYTLELPQQIYYQNTLKLPIDAMISEADAEKHLQVATEYCDADEFTLLSYQVLTENSAEKHAVVCIEIPLGEPENVGER